MTLLLVMNLGFAWGPVQGFSPALLANANQYIGQAVKQPVTK